MNRKKFFVLVGLLLGLVSIILLAGSISQLEFEEGKIVIFGEEGGVASGPRGVEPAPELDGTTRILLAILVLIVVPASIIYVLLNPKAWKRILRNLAMVLMLFLVIMLFTHYFRPGESDFGSAQPPESEQGSNLEELRITDELDINPPSWIGFIVGFLLLLLLLSVIVFIYVRSRQKTDEGELDDLVGEAEGALHEIRSGADLRQTVIRCYHQMCETMSEERGVHRVRAMTPREFEAYLASAGFRDEHIQRLTRLFEGVRYGDESSQPQMEREAESCLEAIVTTYARSAS